jgi:hypothetical protein
MTVIAAAHRIDSVLLGADCRVTVLRPNRSTFTSDTAAKITRLTESIAIGYTGDVQTVSWLYGHLLERQLPKKRADPISVRAWLPRFLRDTYARLVEYSYRVGPVAFLVGATVRGRLTEIPKLRVHEFLHETAAFGVGSHLALRVLLEWTKPGSIMRIPLTAQGMLFKMESPGFEAVDYPPLSCVAIGSGARASEELERFAPLILSDRLDRAPQWFLEAIEAFLSENADGSIGGFVLAASCHHGGVDCLPYQLDSAVRGRPVGVIVRGDHFAILTTDGREILLRYPAEICREALSPVAVNDLRAPTAREVAERRKWREMAERSRGEAGRRRMEEEEGPTKR